MPNASQRYSADTIISNRAALGDAAFVGFSRTLNGQTPSRNRNIACLTPCFLTPCFPNLKKAAVVEVALHKVPAQESRTNGLHF